MPKRRSIRICARDRGVQGTVSESRARRPGRGVQERVRRDAARTPRRQAPTTRAGLRWRCQSVSYQGRSPGARPGSTDEGQARICLIRTCGWAGWRAAWLKTRRKLARHPSGTAHVRPTASIFESSSAHERLQSPAVEMGSGPSAAAAWRHPARRDLAATCSIIPASALAEHTVLVATRVSVAGRDPRRQDLIMPRHRPRPGHGAL